MLERNLCSMYHLVSEQMFLKREYRMKRKEGDCVVTMKIINDV